MTAEELRSLIDAAYRGDIKELWGFSRLEAEIQLGIFEQLTRLNALLERSLNAD